MDKFGFKPDLNPRPSTKEVSSDLMHHCADKVYNLLNKVTYINSYICIRWTRVAYGFNQSEAM